MSHPPDPPKQPNRKGYIHLWIQTVLTALVALALVLHTASGWPDISKLNEIDEKGRSLRSYLDSTTAGNVTELGKETPFRTWIIDAHETQHDILKAGSELTVQVQKLAEDVRNAHPEKADAQFAVVQPVQWKQPDSHRPPPPPPDW